MTSGEDFPPRDLMTIFAGPSKNNSTRFEALGELLIRS